MFISMHPICTWHGMDMISLWYCSGVIEAQVALIAAFRSSELLGLVFCMVPLTLAHRFSLWGSGQVSLPAERTVTPQLLLPLAD